jgi:hypothetical protein
VAHPERALAELVAVETFTVAEKLVDGSAGVRLDKVMVCAPAAINCTTIVAIPLVKEIGFGRAAGNVGPGVMPTVPVPLYVASVFPLPSTAVNVSVFATPTEAEGWGEIVIDWVAAHAAWDATTVTRGRQSQLHLFRVGCNKLIFDLPLLN